MNKAITRIPISKIKSIQIYENKKNNKKSLSQIKKGTGADFIINGGLYDVASFAPVIHLKADGEVSVKSNYTTYGFAWNTANDFDMAVIPSDKDNYIACVALIKDGEKQELNYSRDIGGTRGRTALCRDDDSIYLYCTKDDTSKAKTPEQLQDELYDLGVKSAIMLDGGGSSQCDMAGDVVYSSRRVANYILVYLNKDEKKGNVSMNKKKHTVCLDAGHDAGDLGNCSPDKSYYEYQFAWDISNRVKRLLERNNINVVMSKNSQDEEKSLYNRVRVSDVAKADLFVSAHSNASGASGLEIFTSQGDSHAKRNIAANKIINQMREAGVALRSTPLKHNLTYYVLRETVAPAVLIEYGFHTNKKDVSLLKDDSYKDKLAVATAKGICDFFGIPYKEETKQGESWYADTQKWAKEQGISDGTRPNDPVTRAEVWTMLRRVKGGA